MAATISDDVTRDLPSDEASHARSSPGESIDTRRIFTAPSVWIAVHDESLSARCWQALEASEAVVQSGSQKGTGDRIPEVLITDGAHHFHGSALSVEWSEAHRGPAIIAIGPALADADVCLPADFLPRELLTACRLLAGIVRLRGELAEGQRAERQLEREAHLDPLTQLPNLRAWSEELAARLSRARSTRQPLGVAIVDVDHFKQINDGWGHAAGDQLLIATAQALRQSLRQEDFVARLGGDEFGLLLSGLDADGVKGVLERVHAELPGRIASRSRQVASVTIGYAIDHGQPSLTAEQLTRSADEAWQLAKQRGRNRVMAAR
jgi:diguanylate cyclase (GGDEF)-like protein